MASAAMLQPVAPPESVRSSSAYPASKVEAARAVLRKSTKWNEILLVLRFIRLDPDDAIQILSGRWVAILHTWLGFLRGRRTWHPCGSSECVARDIVDTINQRQPLPSWDGEWLFPAMESSTDVTMIAQRLDLSIRVVWCWIPSRCWPSLALGFEDTEALSFLNTIESFSGRCGQYIRNLEEAGKWNLLAQASILSVQDQLITDLYNRSCNIDTLYHFG
jgi:hypothetical protein